MNIPGTTGHQIFMFLPHRISVSALPWKNKTSVTLHFYSM